MCGIVGTIAARGEVVRPDRLAAAARALDHRGPDDRGYLGWTGSGPAKVGVEADVATGAIVGLAHRRLAILDLSAAGRQPMSSPDGTLHLVFNGEIYNYRELRAELERLGHRFVSQTDSEVLLAAHREWGVSALPRLVGMFAFAVLDLVRRTLFLARDCFGVKPLYYAQLERGFAFASEIKALIGIGDLRARVDPQRLYHYLRFGLTDHDGQTMLSGIQQLPAAHYLEVPIDGPWGPSPIRFWDVPVDRTIDVSFDEAAERLREIFLDSVRLHLRSDVPVGAALSGGIDSSSIVLAVRQLMGSHLDLHAVSYAAGEPEIDERPWTEIAAAAAKATIHWTSPEPGDLVADLERLIAAQGEPFGSTSIYAQFCVFRAASAAGLKVMLDGQGGDELFGGYRLYLAARLVSLLRRGAFARALGLYRRAARLPGSPASETLRSLVFHLLPESLHAVARRAAGAPFAPAWLDEHWFIERGVLTSPFRRASGTLALRDELRARLAQTSLPMLLRYEDRNSMAFSIESRVPFLTPALAEFVFSLPEEYIIAPDGTSKAVFRHAMRGIVPDAILDRRDKIGFASPELRWLTDLRRWVDGILASEAAHQIPALDLTAARVEWNGILRRERRFDWHVWRWINLIRWAERFNVAFDV